MVRRMFSRLAAMAVLVPVSGCAAAMHAPAAFPGAPAAASTSAAIATASATALVSSALDLRGVPYRLGGDTPNRGLDCSGLVRWVFAAHGIDVPRTVAEQFSMGQPIRADDVQSGDLVFFSTIGPGATHVGIATGDSGEFVHAPGTGGVVRTDRLDAPYWRTRIVGARRVLTSGTGARGPGAAKHWR